MQFDLDDPQHAAALALGHVCPFWLARITDPAGGFLEKLDALGAPVASQRRNTLARRA